MTVSREIPWVDPVDALCALDADPELALLHSAKRGGRGRHSYLVLEPFGRIVARDGAVSVDGRAVAGSPFEVLRERMAALATRPAPGLPAFAGGAVGYLGYELARALERVPTPPAAADDPPDMVMLLADVVVAFDHSARTATVISTGLPEAAPAARAARARQRLDRVAARLAGIPPAPPPRSPVETPPIDAEFRREEYERSVRRVIDDVLAGDIFQANLSQRFTAELPPELEPLDLYRRLALVNPAPFAAYLRAGDLHVISASPERFLRLEGDRVETRPIKGTRPRGATPAQDDALAAELTASEKDRAENVMIVDLLRNDLSRVCRDGSVEVPELCALERFASVMHLVSTVTGRLRPGVGAVDLLAACFPGGSITGAPKIRAMEIIAELETRRRGPYCGAMGWIGAGGGLDTSIVIRTYVVDGRRVSFRAGGGIVADSDPAAEYDETLAKARPLIEALGPLEIR